LTLEFTKRNLIWISDELPLGELPRKLRAMVGTKTRIWASCNDTLAITFLFYCGRDPIPNPVRFFLSQRVVEVFVAWLGLGSI
jgi:hypothetical protein